MWVHLAEGMVLRSERRGSTLGATLLLPRVVIYSLDAPSILFHNILELLVTHLPTHVAVDVHHTAGEDARLLRRSLQSELGVPVQRPGSRLGSSSTLMTSRAAL